MKLEEGGMRTEWCLESAIRSHPTGCQTTQEVFVANMYIASCNLVAPH